MTPAAAARGSKSAAPLRSKVHHNKPSSFFSYFELK
jgi:hypothetical protein